MSNSKKIGIFWFVNSQIYTAIEEIQLSEINSSAIIDTELEHWAVWEDANVLSIPGVDRYECEYFDYPRGRVLYAAHLKKHLIYLDAALLKRKTQSLICEAFKIPADRVVWKLDEHYTSNAIELNKLFMH